MKEKEEDALVNGIYVVAGGTILYIQLSHYGVLTHSDFMIHLRVEMTHMLHFIEWTGEAFMNFRGGLVCTEKEIVQRGRRTIHDIAVKV